VLATASGTSAAEIATNVSNSGTFTIRVNNAGSQTNSYRLTLAKTGSPVVVSSGDTGGLLTNGVTTVGTIDTGDLDVWTVSANAGDAVVVRMGQITDVNTFDPWVRVYSPTGVEMSDNFSGTAADEVAFTATNSGTFLVVVGRRQCRPVQRFGRLSADAGQTGSPVVVAPGDTGGP